MQVKQGTEPRGRTCFKVKSNRLRLHRRRHPSPSSLSSSCHGSAVAMACECSGQTSSWPCPLSFLSLHPGSTLPCCTGTQIVLAQSRVFIISFSFLLDFFTFCCCCCKWKARVLANPPSCSLPWQTLFLPKNESLLWCVCVCVFVCCSCCLGIRRCVLWTVVSGI